MDYQEVIEILIDIQSNWDDGEEHKYYAIELGIKALEKQRAKKTSDLEEASQITLRAYENLYNAVDEMFYNISNRWRDGEEGMEIEEVVGDLRKLMYGTLKK